MTETLIVLGVIVFSFALRTVNWVILRKIGAIGFLVAIFLIGYFFSGGKIWLGALSVGILFVFPWIELLTRTRNMRLPVERSLKKEAPPGSQRFPELEEMTEEIETEGFEYINDMGWEWNDTHQFFRFFYHEESRTQAAICFTQQEQLSWACVSVTSRLGDGRVMRSTNLPFTTPMKSAPNVAIRRNGGSDSFFDFVSEHQYWLEDLGYQPRDLMKQSPEDIIAQVEAESGDQISHNADTGIISVCERAKTWRYSWRGLFYVYFQVIKDFVKWC